MPDDRQRHSRLSDEFAGWFGARSEESEKPEASGKPTGSAGRHRGGTPAGPAGEGRSGGHRISARADEAASGSEGQGGGHRIGTRADEAVSGYEASGDRGAASVPSGSLWQPSHDSDLPDATADTTLLNRVVVPQPGPADAETTLLKRIAEPQPVTEPAVARSAPSADDAETTLLDRIVVPRPVAEPTDSEAEPEHDAEPDPERHPEPDLHLDLEPELDAAPEPELEPDTHQNQPLSLRTLVDRHRRRLTIAAAALAVIGVLLALPPVQAQLRDSFTRLPKPYTALYFTSPPQVDGTVLTVPVSVHAVETSNDAYSVRVWTVDSQGRVESSKNADLKWDGQDLSAVVTIPVNPAAAYVWVSLDGSTQSLHYKIAVA